MGYLRCARPSVTMQPTPSHVKHTDNMNVLTGTADLEHLGRTRPVQVLLDLHNDSIEARYPAGDPLDELKAMQDYMSHKAEAALTNIRISTPTGTLEGEQLGDLIVAGRRVGGNLMADSVIGRTLPDDKEDPVTTTLVLRPRNSMVSFHLRPFSKDKPRFEARYRYAGPSFVAPFVVALSPGTARVTAHDGGFVIIGDSDLTPRDELLRLSLGILQGGPVSLRTLLADHKVTLNLAPHVGNNLGPLHKHNQDAQAIVQGLFDFLRAVPAAGLERWKGAISFFLNGLGGIGPIEIRTINLMVFLEMIDDTATLRKRAVALLLDCTADEADLICRTRHRLIHHGDLLGEAALAAQAEIFAHKATLNNSRFVLDPNDPRKTGVQFYFEFAALLNRFWMAKAGYTGEWNDYSSYC